MRNGIRFNPLPLNRLPLAENGSIDDGQDHAGDPVAYHPHQLDAGVLADESSRVQKTFFVFLTVSIACAAVTIGTGSYAAWLSRQQAARQVLTDVNDILKSCQSRMSQLEADLQRLPNRRS